jgi:3-hydroxyisobutyrate dehydrogenase
MDIGLCGTGRMGCAIAQRLMDHGHGLTVWNRSPAKTAPLLERGARAAASPAALAASHDLIITVLTDARAIDAVYHGPQGLASGAIAGKLFIDMGTVAPQSTRDLAERLGAKGAVLLECPVGGSVQPAREGKLFGLAGGDPAAFARARPILEQLCRRVEHVGPNGAGSAMKLAINLPLIVYWETLGEALSLVSDLAVPLPKLLEIIGDSPGGTGALKNRAPHIAAAFAGDVPAVGYDIDGMRKDLGTMLELARALDVELPVAGKALEIFDTAARDGLAARDGSSSMVMWRATRVRGRAGHDHARSADGGMVAP